MSKIIGKIIHIIMVLVFIIAITRKNIIETLLTYAVFVGILIYYMIMERRWLKKHQ